MPCIIQRVRITECSGLDSHRHAEHASVPFESASHIRSSQIQLSKSVIIFASQSATAFNYIEPVTRRQALKPLDLLAFASVGNSSPTSLDAVVAYQHADSSRVAPPLSRRVLIVSIRGAAFNPSRGRRSCHSHRLDTPQLGDQNQPRARALFPIRRERNAH